MELIAALIGLVLSSATALLFVRNLILYRPPPPAQPRQEAASVLIPARNEEANIGPAVRSILESTAAPIEVIVLDDASTDRTAEIVREIAKSDRRVHVEAAPPLPPGWCGKQHACDVLARLASHPILVFLDADVRLKPGAIVRMTTFLEQSGAALVSGVPEQLTRTFPERLLVPLIHFVLLGFLPIGRMRIDPRPALGAGCGQLFVALRHAYIASGGHRAIRDTLHDGVKLPRVFRSAGFRTDLFDATDIASCRMFSTGGAVWRGLARNAGEGLGSPRLIGIATLLLLGGQVLPIASLAAACLKGSAFELAVSLAATGAAFLPRVLGVFLFRQPVDGALLHPLGVCALLGIQWCAFFRLVARRPAIWKGREYLQPTAR
jgi:Glycosyl transferase family 2